MDWYPWGDEAFARAREEDRPIFLSIGYSACHWCHVMERESFEDDEIAAFLNEHFVSVKVDREERPDVDMVYQRAAQVTGVHGGWPLSVFCLPDLRPFWVGTYFPPDDRYGRPGFRRVLRAVIDAYRNRRREVEELAEGIVRALREVEAPRQAPGGLHSALLPAAVSPLPAAAERLLSFFDDRHGGFGGRPKFPNATALAVLLRAGLRGGRQELVDRTLLALRRMAAGGIYDQLGGGFHRYAVDERWLVPHFEKMLYDNALLPPLYLLAYRHTGDEELARIARETLDYVLRELRSPEGGFYSAQDADSEGEEGRYYTWRPEQLRQVLGPDDGELLARHLGVTPEGNFEHGASVLHLARDAEDLARELGLDAEEVRRRIEAGRRRLLAARARRTPPGTDTKVITAWNGLMIEALADAGWCLDEPRFIAAARQAADFLLAAVRRPDGGLLHTWKDGRAAVEGYLDDYACLALGLLRLHQATLERRWLDAALDLARAMEDRFWDEAEGCFFFTAAGADGSLLHRPRDAYDTSTPSSLACALWVLVRLAPFASQDERERWAQRVDRVLAAYAGEMMANPFACASLVLAADEHQSGLIEVTLAAPAGSEAEQARVWEWHRRLGRLAVPSLLVTGIERDGAVRGPQDGRATAYVCRHFACAPPVHDWDALRSLVAAAAASSAGVPGVPGVPNGPDVPSVPGGPDVPKT